VNSPISTSDETMITRPRVTLSPWINEPLPPFHELLSAHDVARLTRRPKVVIAALVLLRRFPQRRRYRGRQIGWLRGEVLEWMSRDLMIDAERVLERPTRRCANVASRQPCLPFDCPASCEVTPTVTTRRTTTRKTKALL
jgi:predicted DNA-binding transcriptional regulator AlpA